MPKIVTDEDGNSYELVPFEPKDHPEQEGAYLIRPVGKRWRVERGRQYWFVDRHVNAEWFTDDYGCEDNRHYEIGNYFPDKAMAEKVAEAVKALLEYVHMETAEPKSWEFVDKAEEARKAVGGIEDE